MKRKVIRVQATIKAFSEDYCLLVKIKNLTDLTSFPRNHVWLPIKSFKSLKTGCIVEFTGQIYRYGFRRKLAFSHIRNIKVVEHVD